MRITGKLQVQLMQVLRFKVETLKFTKLSLVPKLWLFRSGVKVLKCKDALTFIS